MKVCFFFTLLLFLTMCKNNNLNNNKSIVSQIALSKAVGEKSALRKDSIERVNRVDKILNELGILPAHGGYYFLKKRLISDDSSGLITVPVFLDNDTLVDFWQADSVLYPMNDSFFFYKIKNENCELIGYIDGAGIRIEDTVVNNFKLIEVVEKLGGMENRYSVYAYLDTTYHVIKQHKISYDILPPSRIIDRKFIQYNDSSDVKSFRRRWQNIPFEPAWYEYQKKLKQKQ